VSGKAIFTAANCNTRQARSHSSRQIEASALALHRRLHDGGRATVYLTDKIGDGTTTANEIAKVSVTDLPGQFRPTRLRQFSLD
jgi:hypothetical protein